jgi:predicted membrane metal-binding protein
MVPWIFNVSSESLTLQPNKRYRNKIIICLLLAAIAFLLPYFMVIGRDLYLLILSIGIFCTIYALYDFLFKLNLTYVFDLTQRQLFQKVPGLYTRKLMSFDEVYILLETDNSEPHYVLSNRKNRYGKSYAISDYFSGTRKGAIEQERYETEVLEVVIKHLTG